MYRTFVLWCDQISCLDGIFRLCCLKKFFYRDWHRDANTQLYSTRLQVEELTQNQNNASLQLILVDMKDYVMVEAEWDLAGWSSGNDKT